MYVFQKKNENLRVQNFALSESMKDKYYISPVRGT